MQYVKTAVRDKRTGAFLGFGIFLKDESSGEFHLVTHDIDSFNVPFSVSVHIDNLCAVVSRTNKLNAFRGLFKTDCSCSGDSFATASLRFNLGEALDDRFEMLKNVELELVDNQSFSVEGNGEIELDAIAAELRVCASAMMNSVPVSNTSQVSGTDAEVIVKTGYTQNNVYCGFKSYHGYHNNSFNTPIQNDKPYRIGVELELYARSREAYNSITAARSNWFQCEKDSSLNEGSYPIEMKTIPLKASDATNVDFWEAPMEKLKELAKSKGYSSTGLHVHISREILGETNEERENNLGKLVLFYQYFIEDDINGPHSPHAKNVVICGRERGYHAENFKTNKGDFAKKIGWKAVLSVPEAAKEVMDEVKLKARGSRCVDINIQNWNSYKTIEFRKGKGAISKMRLAALCTWWEQMCLYVKETPVRDFDFNVFFNRVMAFPSIAYFFPQSDTEC